MVTVALPLARWCKNLIRQVPPMLWQLLVRNNLGVFLEEVVVRGVDGQRVYV